MDDPTLLSWIERGQNIAALLVAIGVAGEFALGFMAGPARRRVDAVREAEMVRLTTESAKASERAANAEKQAGSFQLQIAQANKGAAEALERAAKAEENLGNAKKDAANANERAAKLEVEALQLQKGLILQGARENLISGDNRRKVVDALKPFAGQKVDVRYSAHSIMVNGAVVQATPLGDDVLGLATALVGIMTDAGWKLPPTPLLYAVQGYGVNVEFVGTASPSTRTAAKALAEALRSRSLEVFGPQIVPQERTERVGTEAQSLTPALDENTIILGILTHPK